MSKAQVTLFIILGIVILIIFGFAFSLTKSVQEKKLEAELEKPIADFLKSKIINYYVTTCLDKVSKEALTLIGNQGGFIHKDQNGLIDWNIPYVEYQGKNVSYQIYSDLSGKLKEKNDLIYHPPHYPCFKRGPGSWTGAICYKTYDHNKPQYFFGTTSDPINNINPDLCKKKITMAGYVCSCSDLPNPLNCEYSLQSQLEYYVKKRVKDCTDFSNIKGYNISKGDIEANISFSDNNVLFKIDFPLTIRVKGSEPIIKVLHFSLPQQIRLKILYNLARELIKEDIDDITFRVKEDGQDLANKYGDITITMDNSFYSNATIVIIEDSKSKIDGKNYVFMFARENRAPALNYMKFNEFTDGNSNFYDLYIIENQTLNFMPTAFDPDDYSITNPLIYDYIGWKSYFLKASTIYKNPALHECINPSSGISEKGRCATYKLTDSDIGPHTLIIKPRDIGNLYDYQEIDILVDDIPDIDLVLSNEYADIDNNVASIEDPFIFDASETKDEWPKPVTLEFKWKHIKPNGQEGFSKNWDWGSKEKVYLPSQYPDINNMAGFFDVFDTHNTHNITLEVKNQQITPLENINLKKKEITVTECLPHRSPHASYPFNDIDWDRYGHIGTIPEDDFQGNHTCCTDNYEYASDSQVCYKLVDYGCYSDFTDPNSEYYDPGELRQQGINPTIDDTGSSGDTSKDVYKRTLIRKCSGSRGNICSGDVETYKIEFYRKCTGTRVCAHDRSPGIACKEP